jgi:hypothetical protein
MVHKETLELSKRCLHVLSQLSFLRLRRIGDRSSPKESGRARMTFSGQRSTAVNTLHHHLLYNLLLYNFHYPRTPFRTFLFSCLCNNLYHFCNLVHSCDCPRSCGENDYQIPPNPPLLKWGINEGLESFFKHTIRVLTDWLQIPKGRR